MYLISGVSVAMNMLHVCVGGGNRWGKGCASEHKQTGSGEYILTCFGGFKKLPRGYRHGLSTSVGRLGGGRGQAGTRLRVSVQPTCSAPCVSLTPN